MQIERCDTCLFVEVRPGPYGSMEDHHAVRVCRRYPPRQPGTIVRMNDWCGDWTTKNDGGRTVEIRKSPEVSGMVDAPDPPNPRIGEHWLAKFTGARTLSAVEVVGTTTLCIKIRDNSLIKNYLEGSWYDRQDVKFIEKLEQ